ncbi:Vacuolar-sorting protein SNF8 [Seminavis robusta]|uniref:Vacuolar-sorting protein SNF8 n=1 Tax=Seminavis robusta TaxID=568900 RepID=A0A9N8EGB9_9STRA|nr:Vacuolar-sorting protein SNF8 [Seminavis robusta]|eukprot:Sro1083_g239390.1 Vacuolar-sorting protein SNF8 (268) ;mRNA; f:23970-24893
MAHRRRGVGVARSGAKNAKIQKKADEMKAMSLQSAMDTCQTLETKLTEFAERHRNEIQNDPAFRTQFLKMCAPLGVDPLQSKKSFWNGVLGVGDFYYELAVKVAETCLATKARNGGIMSITEVQSMLAKRTTRFDFAGTSSASTSTSKKKKKKSKDTYSEEDIKLAIKKLAVLGNGFRTIEVGNSTMIVSVPTELDNDHMEVMTLAKNMQCVTTEQVCEVTGWSKSRAERALQLLLQEGMAWLDKYEGLDFYWFPSIWKETMEEEQS